MVPERVDGLHRKPNGGFSTGNETNGRRGLVEDRKNMMRKKVEGEEREEEKEEMNAIRKRPRTAPSRREMTKNKNRTRNKDSRMNNFSSCKTFTKKCKCWCFKELVIVREVSPVVRPPMGAQLSV